MARTALLLAKINEVAKRLSIPAQWLDDLIYLETGNYSPAITNSIGATGLIQFTKSTALDLGTTTDKLRAMDAVTQMEYVYLYLARAMKGAKPKTFFEFYCYTFNPSWVGKPDTVTLAQKAYKGNASLDFDKDGKITKFEFRKSVEARLKKKPLSLALNSIKETASNIATGVNKAVSDGIKAVSKSGETTPFKVAAIAAGVIIIILFIRRLLRPKNR